MTSLDPVDHPHEAARASAAALAAATGVARHEVAVILGSGWKGAADSMGEVVAEIAMTDLGGFPPATVAGHGTSVRSLAGARPILAFLGRVHLYEGHHPNVVVHAVRTAIAAGCRTVVLTNAAGGVNLALAPGLPVLIADHLNLTGRNPLIGPNDDSTGPRFPDLSAAYSPRLREVARSVDPTLREAVYAGFTGPTYETPAEVLMARTLGAELVGMSTVLETIAAVHLGAEVLGLSLVTNPAAGLGDGALDHGDVLDVAAGASAGLASLLAQIVARV